MKQQVMNAITIAIFTLVTVFMFGNANAVDEFYGKTNINAINTGNLQLKGVTWCKKYFDSCVLKESWIGPILEDRELISAEAFVIMQTGITNPSIVDIDDVGGGKYRIIFVYDQQIQHEAWVPTYQKK